MIICRCGGSEKSQFRKRKKKKGERSAAESVESAALSLESVDDVHGSDRLPLGVLGVGDCVTDHVLQEGLEDAASLLVDETRDTLDTSTTSQTTDGGLGCPGCCREGSSCDAWRLPFQGPCLLCHGQT